jgi:hypothetical protein
MNENDQKPELKLYVVGELTGDPSRWNPFGTYGERALILATSPEEAAAMVDCPGTALAVEAKEPCLLAVQ